MTDQATPITIAMGDDEYVDGNKKKKTPTAGRKPVGTGGGPGWNMPCRQG